MNSAQEPRPPASVRRLFEKTSELPRKLEASLHERPFATTAAVAGVAFVVGTIAGSRLARALLVAATPAIVRRLIDGPLGDDLDAYVRRAFRKTAAPNVS